MDWLPHIVVKVEDEASTQTAITALKTFDIGFPSHKAVVHFIGNLPTALKYCKDWCKEGGHKFIQYVATVKPSQLHYLITKGTRLPVVLIAGTAVFFDDISDYSTTKLFGADTVPQWNLSDKVVNIKSIEKTVIFVAQPMKVMDELEKLTKFVSTHVSAESKDSSKWGNQSVVMDGKVYHQTSGIFNMLYNYNSKLFTNFNHKTADKYDTVFGGSSVASTMAKLEATGRDTTNLMKHVNAALNEDWDGVRGMRKTFLDSVK